MSINGGFDASGEVGDDSGIIGVASGGFGASGVGVSITSSVYHWLVSPSLYIIVRAYTNNRALIQIDDKVNFEALEHSQRVVAGKGKAKASTCMHVMPRS